MNSSNGYLIKGPLIIKPKIFFDSRGYFYESWNQSEFNKIISKKVNFVQDNHSESQYGVLRGLHYQLKPKAQAKLVRCTKGEVYDVLVDIRKDSNTGWMHGNVKRALLSSTDSTDLDRSNLMIGVHGNYGSFDLSPAGLGWTLSGAGAANLTDLITELTTAAGAAAVTLADGSTSGQIKIINHIVDGGGTATVTPTTFANGTTIAFDAVGESVTLVWNSTVGWVASSVNGATVS